MSWKFLNKETGKKIEVPEKYNEQTGVDENREKLIQAGWTPVTPVVSPKDDQTIYIDDRKLQEALGKGFKTPEKQKIEKDVFEGVKERTGPVEAAIGHFSQGSTRGFADELTAGAISSTTGQNYTDVKEGLHRKLDAGAEKYPWLTGAADLAGGVLSPVGGKLEKGGKLLKTAVTIGGIEGAGRTRESLFSKEGIGDVALSMGISGVVGGVAQKLTPKATAIPSKVSSTVSSKLDDFRPTAQSVTKVRTDAMHQSLKEVKAKLKNEFELANFEDSVKAGEKYKIFDGNMDSFVPKLKNKIQSIGEELSVTNVKIKDILTFKDLNVNIKPKVNHKKMLSDFNAKIAKDIKAGRLDKRDAVKVVKEMNYQFNRLDKAIKNNDKDVLLSLRNVRISLDDKLDSNDYKQFGDLFKQRGIIYTMRNNISKLENEFLDNTVKVLNNLDKKKLGSKKLEKIQSVLNYKNNLKDYSDLKNLEETLINTVARSEPKLLGLKEIMTGGVGATTAVMTGFGGPVAVATAATVAGIGMIMKKADTPKGKFLIANLMKKMVKEGGKKANNDKLLNSASSFFGVSKEVVEEYINKVAITSANQKVNQN